MRAADPLIQHDPNAYLILSRAAFRASWQDNPVTGLKTGQAFIGYTDFPFMPRQQFRGACKRILKYGFATIKTTNKGTIVSLDELGFAEFGDSRTTTKTTIGQPSGNHQATTNEEGKKVRRKEKIIPPAPKGVDQENWLEYLRTRTKLKAPNTPRAITTLTNKLADLVKLGHNANGLIETANSNGWKSVYPSTGNGKSRNPTPRELAAALTPPSHSETFFDSPTDLQNQIHQGRREPIGRDQALAVLPAGDTGQGD